MITEPQTDLIRDVVWFDSCDHSTKIIRGDLPARSFMIYGDSENGKIDDNGRTVSRRVLRWNGAVYR